MPSSCASGSLGLANKAESRLWVSPASRAASEEAGRPRGWPAHQASGWTQERPTSTSEPGPGVPTEAPQDVQHGWWGGGGLW